MNKKTIGFVIGVAIVSLFLAPFLCMTAWNTFAWEFNLPTFSFWHWMLVVLAIRFTLGKTNIKTNEKG